MSKKLEQESDVTIPGRAITSTIQTMKSLGSLGVEVLTSLGIQSVNPDKQYPVSVRSSIHDEALNRFGKDALICFGFGLWELYPEMGQQFCDLWANSKKETKSLEVALERYMKEITKLSNAMLKTGTLGGTVEYYINRKKNRDLHYDIEFISASPSRHASYWEGTFLAQAVSVFSDIFDHEIIHVPDMDEDGDGWGKIVFTETYRIKEIEGNIEKNKYLFKNRLNEKLISAVVEDANRQKLEAEKQREKTVELSNQLGKYLPPQIHRAMLAGNYDQTITTRRKKLTIFFSDIKNFTATSEGLQPEDLTKFLNEYFSEMTTIAIACGATIDKYIGDAMMVFFGDPETQGEREDARACVEMALKMQERMVQLKKKWQKEGFADPFQVRIGINTGYCNVGNFGSDQRLTYTIIGGEVNVAQRLEAGADADGILLSYESYAHAKDMIEVEERQAIKMKGIYREIKIFSVIDRKTNASKIIEGSTGKSELNILTDSKPDLVRRVKNIEENIIDIQKNIEQMQQYFASHKK